MSCGLVSHTVSSGMASCCSITPAIAVDSKNPGELPKSANSSTAVLSLNNNEASNAFVFAGKDDMEEPKKGSPATEVSLAKAASKALFCDETVPSSVSLRRLPLAASDIIIIIIVPAAYYWR